ncbi:MAG: FecR domain-containing protein [Siphonobacter sp.]
MEHLDNFVLNDSFRRWALYGEDELFWQGFLLKHPDSVDAIEAARTIVQQLALEETDEEEVSAYEEEVWNQIQYHHTAAKPRILRLRWAAVAASLALLVAAVGIFYWKNRPVRYQTDYGEFAKITLPDGSKVTLSANSELEYESVWDDQDSRVVRLNGEAYFSVVHTRDNQKFRVKTPDDVQVEVLGTEFTVDSRREKTRVVLASGKIRLTHHQDNILMKPGELVEISSSQKKLIPKQVRAEVYFSWKEARLVFYKTTLAEILEKLEERNGLQIEVTNKALLQQEITGTIPNANLDKVLESLSSLFDLKITKRGNVLIISEI